MTPPRTQLTTFIVLCSPKSNSSQKVLSWNPILRILVVPENPATGEQERRALPLFPPDFLVLRMLVLRTSDCPSPTLTAQLESGQLMRSTY